MLKLIKTQAVLKCMPDNCSDVRKYEVKIGMSLPITLLLF